MMNTDTINELRRYLRARIDWRLEEIDWLRARGLADAETLDAEIIVLRGELAFLHDIECGDADA